MKKAFALFSRVDEYRVIQDARPAFFILVELNLALKNEVCQVKPTAN